MNDKIEQVYNVIDDYLAPFTTNLLKIVDYEGNNAIELHDPIYDEHAYWDWDEEHDTIAELALMIIREILYIYPENNFYHLKAREILTNLGELDETYESLLERVREAKTYDEPNNGGISYDDGPRFDDESDYEPRPY